MHLKAWSAFAPYGLRRFLNTLLRLSGSRLSRLPNEPLAQWQTRLEEAWPDSPGLPRIFHLHRRLRFDPRGLESRDREVLKREAAAWLAQWAAASEPLAPGKGRD